MFSATYSVPSGTAVYKLTFQFSSGESRSCTVEMGAPHQSYAMPPQGSLVGFTTDASGRLMTGVWKSVWSVPQGQGGPLPGGKWEFMEVPTDFVVTGGGAVGAEFPNGAFLTNLQQAGSDVWETTTLQLQSQDAYIHEAHAIAMKIEGLTHAELKAATSWIQASGTTAAHPSVSLSAPSGWLVTGGGGLTSRYLVGQYLTVSAPVLRIVIACLPGVSPPGCQTVYAADGWRVSAKDHIVASPAHARVEVYLIQPEFIIAGQRYQVAQSVKFATSAVAGHPSVAVSGTQGQFALTGVGASVDWQSYGWAGNMLWKLLPRPDIAGAEAASKDHTYSSPATVTAYAIGLKLVPIPFD